jgi:hypothetical protein
MGSQMWMKRTTEPTASRTMVNSHRSIRGVIAVRKSSSPNEDRLASKSALPDLNGGQVDLQSTALPD